MNENNINENVNKEPVSVPSEQEDAVANEPNAAVTAEPEVQTAQTKAPKKRFTALQTVLISAICVVLTFMLTSLTVINAMNAYFKGVKSEKNKE